MKRTAVSLALIIALAFGADELRAVLESAIFFRIDPQLAGGVTLLMLRCAVYMLIFLFAGALAAARFRSLPSVVLAGLAVGLLVLTPGIVQGDIRPVHYSTHGPGWLNALGWVNWFGPPAAGALGAVMLATASKSKARKPTNAA